MKAFAATVLAALSSVGLAQDLCGQYDYLEANGYAFNNNAWGSASGSGSQCTHVTGTDSGGVSWNSEWSWSGGEDNVKAYPYSGRLIEKRIVSSYSSLPSSASWSYQGGDVRANVAYDLFTAANVDHDTSSGDYELMIWLARIGGVYPIGSSVGNVNVGGQDWELYTGYNGAMRVYSFVAPSERQSFSGDIKEYFSYVSTNQDFPIDSQYLITYQFGSESFTGTSAVFTVSSWTAEAS
jgi:xyloglucan-specific endo-beta-1,4-glucanase